MWEICTLKAFQDNFIFALLGPDRQCAVVDPGDSAPVFDFIQARGLRLSHILCTHHHNDHIGGVAELQNTFDCKVFASALDSSRISGPTVIVSENAPAQMWGRTIDVFEIPGHTLGHIAYWLRDENALFVGDTVFSAGCGRLFEGTPEQMFASLQKIKALPPSAQIYFSHEYTLRNLQFVLAKKPSPEATQYFELCQNKLASGLNTVPTTLATELLVNPFLQAQSAEELAHWRSDRNLW